MFHTSSWVLLVVCFFVCSMSFLIPLRAGLHPGCALNYYRNQPGHSFELTQSIGGRTQPLYAIRPHPDYLRSGITTSKKSGSAKNSLENDSMKFFKEQWATLSKVNFMTLTNAILLGNLILTQISILLPTLVQRVTKVDALIMKGEVHRLLTSPFFHNSFQHFGSSAYTIYNFGARVRLLVILCIVQYSLIISHLSTSS